VNGLFHLTTVRYLPALINHRLLFPSLHRSLNTKRGASKIPFTPCASTTWTTTPPATITSSSTEPNACGYIVSLCASTTRESMAFASILQTDVCHTHAIRSADAITENCVRAVSSCVLGTLEGLQTGIGHKRGCRPRSQRALIGHLCLPGSAPFLWRGFSGLAADHALFGDGLSALCRRSFD
jgi:hypothetical protein